MKHVAGFLVVAIVALAVLVSAGPTLIALAHAAVPLIAAVGVVIGVLRIIWHFTSRY
jgi:hypothetical protein